jgi:hypothetical protein
MKANGSMEVVMIINPKILNIPPFISTQWSQIEFLTTEGNLLCVHLKSGKSVSIPELNEETIQKVFQMHGSYAEIERPANLPHIPPLPMHPPVTYGSVGFKIAFANGDPQALGLPLQHMEELREAPNLPPEVLEKVKTISKLVPAEDLVNSPKPVEQCNCPFCQIANVIHNDAAQALQQVAVEVIDEPVKDEDLKFEQWSISQTGEQLFEVRNKLDLTESYNVFLGEPVGCTCGRNGCEHILAVLKS